MSDLAQKIDSNNNGDFICGVVEGFYGKPWTFEQRHDLFKRLKDMRLNSFMYAPKDDTKHRAKWRTLYSDSEAKKMRSLIEEAKMNGIDFYYSLAPGLDMVYSDQEEIDCLISKYDQLVELGCQCFAILFDDIEPTITNDKDSQVFKSYASAQVSVTNLIFEHLNKPKFLFCPTEYCESRAVPNVSQSFYLNTIGSGLHEGIDVMWSGSRVISRLITDESIDQLARVIRRAPVIWENLHANDYDKRRIFMGPYSGRTTSIISKLRGVLTNPNCEYEANHIAIHTLAQWSRCKQDINEHNRCDKKRRTCFDLLLDSRDDDESYDETVYDPHRALVLGIRSWLPRVLEDKPFPKDMNEFVINHFGQEHSKPQDDHQRDDDDVLCQDSNSEECNNAEDDINIVDMISDDVTQSSEASTDSRKIKMDTTTTDSELNTDIVEAFNGCDSCEMQDANQLSPNQNIDDDDTHKGALDLCTIAKNTEPINIVNSLNKSLENDVKIVEDIPRKGSVEFSDLSLLVELFFLPFEHGTLANNLLHDLRWLRDNCDLILKTETTSSISSSTTTTTTTTTTDDNKTNEDDCNSETSNSEDSKEPEIWRARADKLNMLCTSIIKLVDTMLYNCPNKALVVELYPYLIDLRNSIAMLIDYIRFLRCRGSNQDSYDDNENQQKFRLKADIDLTISSADEQEPWVHRGGLMGDIHRIIYH